MEQVPSEGSPWELRDPVSRVWLPRRPGRRAKAPVGVWGRACHARGRRRCSARAGKPGPSLLFRLRGLLGRLGAQGTPGSTSGPCDARSSCRCAGLSLSMGTSQTEQGRLSHSRRAHASVADLRGLVCTSSGQAFRTLRPRLSSPRRGVHSVWCVPSCCDRKDGPSTARGLLRMEGEF